MTTGKANGSGAAPAFLLGAALVATMVGCGKSGLEGAGQDAVGGSLSSAGQQGGAAGSGPRLGSGGSAGGQTGIVLHEPRSHRAKAPACTFVRVAEPDAPQNGTCSKHADCVARPNGECMNTSLGSPGRSPPAYFTCVYTLCASESDCTDDEVCDCSEGSRGGCVSRGNCRLDSDCGGGAFSYCSRAYGWDCGGYHPLGSYYCHTPRDTCLDDSDCTGKDFCDFDVVEGRWECTSPNLNCAIG